MKTLCLLLARLRPTTETPISLPMPATPVQTEALKQQAAEA